MFENLNSFFVLGPAIGPDVRSSSESLFTDLASMELKKVIPNLKNTFVLVAENLVFTYLGK